jgi:putative transcriptional regulator
MRNQLRALRADRDWSQGDLAEKLGVSRQTVNAIETEKYDPSLPLAFKIASLFKMSIERSLKTHEVINAFWACAERRLRRHL